jgi:hypothetical protein
LSGAFAKQKFETPDMVCRTCGKRARGPTQPGWLDMDLRDKDTGELQECVAFCRVECMTTWISKETKAVIDPTAVELDILQSAGQAGGEYLDSIGKFNLEALSGDEWMVFLQTIIGKYEDLKIPF